MSLAYSGLAPSSAKNCILFPLLWLRLKLYSKKPAPAPQAFMLSSTTQVFLLHWAFEYFSGLKDSKVTFWPREFWATVVFCITMT